MKRRAISASRISRRFIVKEGQTLIGWRDVPTTLDGLGKAVIEQMPVIRQLLHRARCQLRRSGRVRAQAARDPQADAKPAGGAGGKARPARAFRASTCPQLLDAARWSTRACCSRRRSGSFYDDLRNPLCHVGARPRSPALLDQHLPQLEAGAPLPVHRAQRRNQHRARQRQLDERAPSHDGIASCWALISTRCGRSSRTASRTPPASTMRSNCCSRAATASPTR